MKCRVSLYVAAVFVMLVPASFGAKSVRVDLKGQRIEGTPLSWSKDNVALLGRDGALWQFRPSEAKNAKPGSAFRPYSQSELRGLLHKEFGRGFDVSGTGQYLVVHPVGQRDVWAQRFEDLYRSMIHYFRTRGFPMSRPKFPFVAVVFPRQHDFLKYAHKHKLPIGRNVLGYYLHKSNRIYLYDTTAGKKNDENWYVNAETIIHEAAHQTAFNTGLHNRFYRMPTWVVEGIGTLFEAPGVFDSRRHPELGDRINRPQLAIFQQRVSSNSESVIRQLVASDRMFQIDPTSGYAAAWAMSFYMSEREPRKYTRYLKKAASRPAFREYTTEQRISDFTSVFGTNMKMLDARLTRFLASLP